MSPLFRPSQSLHYSLGFDIDIDFCVWALERDGLRVPPFDRHPDGDGALRALGLDAGSWRRWFDRVVRETADLHSPSRTPFRDARERLARVAAFDPASVWNGAPAVGVALAALRDEHEEIVAQRRVEELPLDRVFHACDRRLWRDLAPDRRTLPPVRVAYVGYPSVVRAVVPPADIVLGIEGWQPEPDELAAEILAGAAALDASSREAP